MTGTSEAASIKGAKSCTGFLPEPAGLFGLATFWSLCLLAGRKSLVCADTLWHVKVGQIILDRGRILDYDIFSHTVPGQPWISHEWLAEVFMALCYNLAGLPGVALAFFLMVGLTITLLFKAAQQLSDEWSAFCVVSIAALFAQSHLLARPHIFTWLFCALFLYLLIQNDRRLWLLPALTALWGNLHGGVLLGLILQGAFLSGRFLDSVCDRSNKGLRRDDAQPRRPLYVFLASMLALGCNPFGYALLLFPFQVSAAIFSQGIDEWRAPNLQEMWYVRVWLIMLATLVACQGRKITWTWRLLLAFFVYQGLGHVRHLSIAAMVLAPWTAWALHDFSGRFLKGPKPSPAGVATSARSGPVLMATSFAVLFLLSMWKPAGWQEIAAQRFPLPVSYSQGAISYLQANGFPGEHLLNEYSLGGFLIFSLEPPPKVFIDGRADMYGEKVFSDYAQLTLLQPGFERILAEYAIDWILYPRDALLVRFLEHQPGWQVVYRDDQVAILTLKE